MKYNITEIIVGWCFFVYLTFLIFIAFASNLGSLLFNKFNSNTLFRKGSIGYALYIFITSSVACVFFYISNGFHLSLNLRTFIYSLAFSLICFLASLLNLIANKFSQISNLNVVKSAASMVLNSVIGFSLFSEAIDKNKLFKICLMLLSIILVSVQISDNGNQKEYKDFNRGKANVYYIKYGIIMLLTLLVGAGSTVINKFYVLDSAVCDNNSFFFFTNVLLILISVIWFFIASKMNMHKMVELFAELGTKKVLAFSGNNICSNIGSLVYLLILARMDVSVYSPIQAGLAIVAGAVASFILREKLKITSLIAVAVSIIAIFINI